MELGGAGWKLDLDLYVRPVSLCHRGGNSLGRAEAPLTALTHTDAERHRMSHTPTPLTSRNQYQRVSRDGQLRRCNSPTTQRHPLAPPLRRAKLYLASAAAALSPQN